MGYPQWLRIAQLPDVQERGCLSVPSHLESGPTTHCSAGPSPHARDDQTPDPVSCPSHSSSRSSCPHAFNRSSRGSTAIPAPSHAHTFHVHHRLSHSPYPASPS